MQLFSQIAPEVFWFLVGVVFAVGGLRLGLGKVTSPGPGFFPFALGSLLIVLSVIVITQHLKHGPEVAAGKVHLEREAVASPQHSAVIKALLTLSLFIAVSTGLGFLVSLFLFNLLLVKGIGRHSWAKSIAYALIAAVLVHLIFERWLMIRLPMGILEKVLY